MRRIDKAIETLAILVAARKTVPPILPFEYYNGESKGLEMALALLREIAAAEKPQPTKPRERFDEEEWGRDI